MAYLRRSGTSSIAGQLYESKLLALVLIRLKEMGCKFQLGSNVDGIGHFDDLVLRYNRDHLVFVQAKHRDEPAKNKIDLGAILEEKKGVFSVHTNFLNYLLVRQKFGGTGFFAGNLADLNVEFVLLTTTMTGFIPKHRIEPNPLLITTGADIGTFFRFPEEDAIVDDLCNHVDNKLVVEIQAKEGKTGDIEFVKRLARHFLQSFKIYCNQAKQDSVENLIKQKMRGKNSELLYLVYHNLVQEYWMKKVEIDFLNENDNILEDARRKVEEQPILAYVTEICLMTALQYDLQFTKCAEKMLDLEQLDPNRRIVNVWSSSPRLTWLKLTPYLRQQFGSSLAIVDMNQIGGFCDDCFSTFLQLKQFELLIVLPSKLDELRKITQLASQVETSKKWMIVVSDEAFSANIIRSFPVIFTIQDDCLNLDNLKRECQDSILSNKTVTFQGKVTNLLAILGKTEERNHIPRQCVTGPILLKLIQEDSLELAPILDKQIPYYVARTVTRVNRIDHIGNDEDFVIVEEDQQIVSNNHDLVIISDTASKYEQICGRFPNRNIHWLKKSSYHFLWQQSSNSLEKIRSLMKRSDKRLAIGESIVDPVTIIAAEPGMGKSTILTELLLQQKVSSFGLIVRINLREFTEKFENLKAADCDKAKNFLCHVMETSSKRCEDLVQFERKIFERYYNNGDVILLIDGFDEIVPSYTLCVFSLLDAFINDNLRQIIITTRDNSAKIVLENHLKIFAHALNPFNEQNVLEFLGKFWKLSVKNLIWNQERFEQFTTVFIEEYSRVVSCSFINKYYGCGHEFDDELTWCKTNFEYKASKQLLNCKQTNFIRVPLHVEMIASCVQNSFEEYQNNASPSTLNNLQDILNLCALYRSFIRSKLLIYLEEKYSIKISIQFVKDEGLEEKYQNEHKRLALSNLFNKDSVRCLLPPEEFSKLEQDFRNIKDGKEKKGFVTHILDGKPQFTHLSFAEFFAAEAIWEGMKMCSIDQFRTIVKTVLLDDLLKNDRRQISLFLQNLALGDSSNIDKISEKERFLKGSFYRSILPIETEIESYALLLGLVERFTMDKNRDTCTEPLSVKEKWALLKVSASMGYLRHVSILTNKLTIKFVENELVKGSWDECPLVMAAKNHRFEVVKLFLEKYSFNSALLDKYDRPLFNVMLLYGDYVSLLKLVKIRISNLGEPDRHGNFPLTKALYNRGTPQNLVEAVVNLTDPKVFNRRFLTSYLGHYLFLYNTSLTKLFLERGFHFQQPTIEINFDYIYSNGGWNIFHGIESDPGETWFGPGRLEHLSRFSMSTFDAAWIDQMHLLCENGIGFPQKSLEVVKEIYRIFKALVIKESLGQNWKKIILKAIVSNENCNKLEIVVKQTAKDNPTIRLKINCEFGGHLSNLIETKTRNQIIAYSDNLALCTETCLSSIKSNCMDEIPGDLTALISEIIENKQISMLLNVLNCQNLEKCTSNGQIELLTSKLYELLQIMDKLHKSWKNLISGIKTNTRLDLGLGNNPKLNKTIINCLDDEYGSPLHLAIFTDNFNIAKWLLENGAFSNVLAKSTNLKKDEFTAHLKQIITHDKTSPIHLAAAFGNLKCTQLLLDHGADINTPTLFEFFTPLHVAASEGHAEIVKFLLKQGAKKGEKAELNNRRVRVETPLSLAKRYNRTEIIKLLNS